MFLEPKRLHSTQVLSSPSVWKHYNRMTVLHFFRLNSTLYLSILFACITPCSLHIIHAVKTFKVKIFRHFQNVVWNFRKI